MLTEEKINLNYTNFISKMEKYGMYTEKLKEDAEFNKSLRVASGFIKDDTGGCYDGSLIEHINRIATIAFKINEIVNVDTSVQIESIIKVCYLHSIGKVLMIQKNTVDWEIKKGKKFTFKEDLLPLKTSEYSILVCNKYGIELTPLEYSAILSADKEDDVQTKYYNTSIGQILKSAIEIATTERRLKYNLNKK